MGQKQRREREEAKISAHRRMQTSILVAGGLALGGYGLWSLRSAPTTDVTPITGLARVLDGYSVIAYEKSGNAGKTCYIIGQSHANLFFEDTEAQKTSPRCQLEILRTIERIYAHDGTQLVLREGMEASREVDDMYKQISSGLKQHAESIRTSDARNLTMFTQVPGVDAIMVAGAITPIAVRSAENQQLLDINQRIARYWSGLSPAAREADLQLTSQNASTFMAIARHRSAYLLQKMPAIAQEEKTAGRIGQQNAIVVIGLTHLNELFGFVRTGKITLDGIVTEGIKPLDEPLAASDWTYCFIIPKSITHYLQQYAPDLAKQSR